MKVITKQEYAELMEFLEPHLKALWDHENKERIKKGKEVLNVFQFGFSILDIYPYKIDDNIQFYMIFNSTFLNLIYRGVEKALEEYPDKFGTGNAQDVIEALYNVSAYQRFGSIDDYIQFLTDHLCCYIVYRENGIFSDNILRVDLLRQILPSKDNDAKNDFVGGLLHTLKHFSIDNQNLSTGTYVHNIFDIHHLMYLIAMSFRLRTGEGCKYKAVQELSDGKMLAFFYREPETGIYFLNSYYKKN